MPKKIEWFNILDKVLTWFCAIVLSPVMVPALICMAIEEMFAMRAFEKEVENAHASLRDEGLAVQSFEVKVQKFATEVWVNGVDLEPYKSYVVTKNEVKILLVEQNITEQQMEELLDKGQKLLIIERLIHSRHLGRFCLVEWSESSGLKIRAKFDGDFLYYLFRRNK